MIEIVTFPSVESVHQGGVKLAQQGRIEEARGMYASASNQARLLHDSTPYEVSRRLHEARITRDSAFLGILELSPSVDEIDPHNEIENQLKYARMQTEALLDIGKKEFKDTSWSRLTSEHGATVGLQARLIMRRAVAGQDDLGSAVDLFAEAHEILEQGSISYYGASNAMRAAGAERLRGKPFSMSRWICHAMLYLTTPHSLGDVKSSALTIGANGILLRSKAAVIEGVKQSP